MFSRVLGLLVLLVFVTTAQAQRANMVPVTIDGQTVRLEMRIYTPGGEGPFPILIFNHGSTGYGRNPALFRQPIDIPRVTADFFVERGWAVVLPARRGRGGSEGLYDEGFAEDRALGYTCDPSRSIPGADRALRDIEAAMDAILAMPFVDRHRVVMGGQSRGGILSIAYAGSHPEQVKGIINFVGGWMSTGCSTAVTINQTLFKRGASYPALTLWLYSDRDPFYPLSHSRENFAAFQAAGGKGIFRTFLVPTDASGHSIYAYPDLWGSIVETYLKAQGLPTTVR